MSKSTIQNNFGTNKIKTVAPAELQPTDKGNASVKSGTDNQANSNVVKLPTSLQGLNDDFVKRAEELLGKPAVPSTQRVEVDLVPNNQFFGSMIQRIHDEIVRVAKAVTEPKKEFLTKDEVSNYYTTILKMRVDSVNGDLKGDYRDLRGLMVHPFFAVILDQIGQVKDTEFGLFYTPVISKDIKVLKPEEMLIISDKMSQIEGIGLSLVPVTVWKDSLGSLEFMSLQHLEGVVKGLRVNHTVFGLFAVLFDTMAVYSATGLVPKVVYGYEDNYRGYLSAIFNKM